MRSMLAGFTTRGRAFVAAGAAAGVLGLGLGQRTLLSIGGVLIILPVLSVLAASRTRYRISWARAITGMCSSRAKCLSRRESPATCSCRLSRRLSGSMSCK